MAETRTYGIRVLGAGNGKQYLAIGLACRGDGAHCEGAEVESVHLEGMEQPWRLVMLGRRSGRQAGVETWFVFLADLPDVNLIIPSMAVGFPLKWIRNSLRPCACVRMQVVHACRHGWGREGEEGEGNRRDDVGVIPIGDG